MVLYSPLASVSCKMIEFVPKKFLRCQTLMRGTCIRKLYSSQHGYTIVCWFPAGNDSICDSMYTIVIQVRYDMISKVKSYFLYVSSICLELNATFAIEWEG